MCVQYMNNAIETICIKTDSASVYGLIPPSHAWCSHEFHYKSVTLSIGLSSLWFNKTLKDLGEETQQLEQLQVQCTHTHTHTHTHIQVGVFGEREWLQICTRIRKFAPQTLGKIFPPRLTFVAKISPAYNPLRAPFRVSNCWYCFKNIIPGCTLLRTFHTWQL